MNEINRDEIQIGNIGQVITEGNDENQIITENAVIVQDNTGNDNEVHFDENIIETRNET